jgi:hypothetical protein
MRHLIALIAGALLASGCDSLTKSCTLIGCNDGMQLTLRTADDRWADGAYTLDVTIDGEAHACAFSVPEDIPEQEGRIVDLACDSDLTIQLVPKTECTEMTRGDAVSQSCEWIEDAWLLQGGVQGMVENLSVRVRRDDATLLDRTLEPEYVESRPNGPDCEPLCRQATVELTIE